MGFLNECWRAGLTCTCARQLPGKRRGILADTCTRTPALSGGMRMTAAAFRSNAQFDMCCCINTGSNTPLKTAITSGGTSASLISLLFPSLSHHWPV
jgi:hypothetical protein